MRPNEALTKYIGALVDELSAIGVEDVVISPGSRSTPISMLVNEHPSLNGRIAVDERGAGFFALGMAKNTKKPTALICTSGTAASNYYPAIAEAKESRIPLIVITADRPHELRDVGAPQTMNQLGMYGSFVKQFVELALPEENESMYQYVRTVINRMYKSSMTAPKGPVHLNVPLREPLVPNFEIEDLFQGGKRSEAMYTHTIQTNATLPLQIAEQLMNKFSVKQKGLLVCGPYTDEVALTKIVQLGEKLGFPIICDPLSNARSMRQTSNHLIDSYDTFLRFEDVRKELEAELVIRFGAMPVSKAFTQYVKGTVGIEQYVIDEGDIWRDPTLLANTMISCGDLAFCDALLALPVDRKITTDDWLEKWNSINQQTRAEIKEVEKSEELFEGKIVQILEKYMPENSMLFVGNSMPIRDVDTFFSVNEKEIKIAGNRGVNGIDGTIATALGMAATGENVYLLIGDLTFYHDMNSLVLSKLHNLPITVILINNNGGGIFSFLPQSKEEKHFETLFGTPLNIEFEYATRLFGGEHYKIDNWDQFINLIQQKQNGLRVLELATNRQENYEMHQKIWSKIRAKLN
jgi:2-succinyl-5-enolpyruvyl-6-hydroxy-3-cyclohexene-1-carboxylate synthase